MRAFVLDDFDTPPRLRDDLPTPGPGGGEIAVRVRASSVNTVDNAIAAGMLRGMAEYEFPVTLGRDFAGVVEAVGPGADAFAAALADGGRIASPVGAAGEGPNRFNVMGSADPGAVQDLAELLEGGGLRIPIQRTYALERVGSALADLGGEHTQGKLAITVAEE